MNVVVVKGRLTRDPQVRYTQGANPVSVAQFGLAVGRRFKREGEPDVDFFNIVAFGKQAETIEQYFRKGSEIVVHGRLQTGRYTNKDGQEVRTVDIVLENFDFCGSKSDRQTSSQDTDGFKSFEGGEMPFN